MWSKMGSRTLHISMPRNVTVMSSTVEFIVFSGECVQLGLQIVIRFLELRQVVLETTVVTVGGLQLFVEVIETSL